jgi:Papain fold toxin 1, glutamine deamidase
VGLTYATVGAGQIKIRNNPTQNLITLNRDAANVQRVVKDQTIDIKIPAVNLKTLVDDVDKSVNFFRALTADVSDLQRANGNHASDQYINLILRGATDAEARAFIASPRFQAMLAERRSYEAMKASKASPQEILNALGVIAAGEEVYRDPVTGQLMVKGNCNTTGPCDQKVSELKNVAPEVIKGYIERKLKEAQGSDSAAYRDAIECAIAAAFATGDMSYFNNVRDFGAGQYAAGIDVVARATKAMYDNNGGRIKQAFDAASGAEVNISRALVFYVVAAASTDRVAAEQAAKYLLLTLTDPKLGPLFGETVLQEIRWSLGNDAATKGKPVQKILDDVLKEQGVDFIRQMKEDRLKAGDDPEEQRKFAKKYNFTEQALVSAIFEAAAGWNTPTGPRTGVRVGNDPADNIYATKRPMTEVFPELDGVNPFWRTEARDVNCVSCVNAVTSRLSGEDINAVARPNRQGYSGPFGLDPTAFSFETMSVSEAIRRMTIAGDGAIGAIQITLFKDASGNETRHAISVVNKGGNVYFIDAQRGDIVTMQRDYSISFGVGSQRIK